MTSAYPTTVDEQPPTLVGGQDIITPDVLSHVTSMLQEVQTALGLRPADQTALDGGLDFGTVADCLLHHSRVESGRYGPTSITSWSQLAGIKIPFSVDRFSAPPIVRLQMIQPYNATNNWVYVFEPRLVTERDFFVAFRGQASVSAPTPTFNLEFDWFAIQPPFGEQSGYAV